MSQQDRDRAKPVRGSISGAAAGAGLPAAADSDTDSVTDPDLRLSTDSATDPDSRPTTDSVTDLSADPTGDGPPSVTEPTVTWSALPEGARVVAVALAARTLGSVPADQVPASLAAVARFTPGKRARRGSAPLSKALERDASFRALVAQNLVDVSADTMDPSTAAARAFLLQIPDSDGVIAAAQRADELTTLRAQVTQLAAAVDKLTARLSHATQSPPDRRRPGAAERDAGEAGEAERLRRRLREQGTRLKRVQEESQRAVTEAERDRDRAVAQADQDRASADRWRSRAEQEAHRAAVAQQVVDRYRDEAGRARADADRRIDLLLQTIARAATGLRREWQLTAGGADPADVVARDLPDATGGASRSVDAALLLEWFSLPHAHLIVDGYNVTKTGYPDLALADQRDRLTRALAALVARTGVEVTVVFDGAAVVAPTAPTRGVRVMFSPPGVIADDVIRRLAAAEPAGRVLIVVSSDREVVDGVRRSGARTAPSTVLLAVLRS